VDARVRGTRRRSSRHRVTGGQNLRFIAVTPDGRWSLSARIEIDHTPRNETIRVTTGNASLVGERKQTNFHVDTGDKWMEMNRSKSNWP